MSMTNRTVTAAAMSAMLAATVVNAGGGSGRPPSFVRGEISWEHYDGVSDDLLTGGLGASGLASPVPPALSAPPTPTEIRTRAIHTNYRALVDTAPGGGYGTLYGPGVAADGTLTGDEGLIPGTEVIAFAGDASGRLNVTMMVQVPDSFDPDNPCIVTGPSSGSRGVYGAIGTSGEWGLKNGCAVAYTDKGTGTGAHRLADDTVGLIDGTRADADDAGKSSTFTARLSDRAREAFLDIHPDRIAFKHAHSQVNPEKDWGKNVLQSVEFAFWVLNRMHGDDGKSRGNGRHGGGDRFHPGNTIVIASSVSNGGGASVRAAEEDEKGLIDGIAVSEPNVNPQYEARFSIVQGDGPPLVEHSRSLIDYTTLLNVYQGCASAAPALATAPFNFAPSPAACQSLHALELLSGSTLEQQAAEAQAVINAEGILAEQNELMPSHWFLSVPQSIAVTYANSYSRSGVQDNVCGYSFAAIDQDGFPAPLDETLEDALFSMSNGIPPSAGVRLINNTGPLGAREYQRSTPDQYLDGALCLRSLAMARDAVSDERLRGRARALSRKLESGVSKVRASGRLKGKPAIFVTGRSDAILPPNHTSRAYFGLNRYRAGSQSRLSYVEVLNAQHLDALNGFGGFKERYIPLHHYFVQALDLMLDHLRKGAPLPPSQLVRTTPRGTEPGGQVPDITLANLPHISPDPAPGDRIVFADNQVRIPD